MFVIESNQFILQITKKKCIKLIKFIYYLNCIQLDI
jgi:hypothetical protein